MLEELRRTEEQRRSLLRAKRFTNIKQVHDLRKQRSASSRADGRLVEDPGLLNDSGLVVIVLVDPGFLVFLRRQSHRFLARRCVRWTRRVDVDQIWLPSSLLLLTRSV